MQIAQVSPQAIMRTVAELKDWIKQRAPFKIKVLSTPGQAEFDLRCTAAADCTALREWLSQGPLAGVYYLAVNPLAKVAAGKVQLDVVMAGTGRELVPEVRNYQKHQSPTTEVAIESAIFHDLYLAMRPAQGQRHVSLLAVVFPFVFFLWLGAIVMLFGGVVCLLLVRQVQTAAASEPTEPVGPGAVAVG